MESILKLALDPATLTVVLKQNPAMFVGVVIFAGVLLILHYDLPSKFFELQNKIKTAKPSKQRSYSMNLCLQQMAN